MNIYFLKTLIIVPIILLATGCFGQQPPTSKITVHVVDEDGKPIPGTFIGIGGGLSTPDNGPVPRSVNGTTNNEGQFFAIVASAFDQYGAFAKKEGYYGSDVNYYPSIDPTKDWMRRPYQTGKWEPWERTINITLRPIKNPVPMYVKAAEVHIKESDSWVGYDLEMGDMVAPYGSGVVSDIEFKNSGKYKDEKNYSTKLEIRFPGEGNGIIEYTAPDARKASSFPWPYEAPNEGYKQELVIERSRRPSSNDKYRDDVVETNNKNHKYMYRIRSILDDDANCIQALYGKIYPAFQYISGGGEGGYVASIYFTYYLNPYKTRNLESSMKSNLFPGYDAGGVKQVR